MKIKLIAVFHTAQGQPFITVPFTVEQGDHVFNALWKATNEQHDLVPGALVDLIYDEISS